MMDLKFKGPKWVGNIYQKFEAICHEVDDIVKQDTIKYVENQMNSVGKNVKKFCSDLLPPSGHPVKHVAEELVIENNADVSTKTRKSLEENYVDATEKQSSTESIIVDPVTSQLSLASSEHCLGDQPTEMDTLEESESNLHIGKVGDILTNENSAEDNEEIAKPILSMLTSPDEEEHIAESSTGVFVHSEYENRPADSTVMVSTTEPKVMDPGNKLSLVSSQSHLLEKWSSTSIDTLEVSESISCVGKIDGILTNKNSEANNKEFSAEVYTPLLLESTSPGVTEHFTMSAIRVFDQNNDENRHADLSTVGPETPAELEFESLQNWTLWDDYVDETEYVSGTLNSTSEMSFSVVSAEDTKEDVGIASFSKSNAKESLKISEKLNQEAKFCRNSVEEVGSAVAHETSAHSWEFESLLDSIGWDDFADKTECHSGGSNTTSETVISVVSGENFVEEVGLTSFNCSSEKPLLLSEDSPQKLSTEPTLSNNSSEEAGRVGDRSEVACDTSVLGVEFEFQLSSPSWDIQCVSGASKATSEVACSVVSEENAAAEIRLSSFSSSNGKEFLKFTENPPQMLSVETTFGHSSGEKDTCVSDSLDGFSSSAPALTVSAAGTSGFTETIPLTVSSGKQQIKICEFVQHDPVMSSSYTGCLDESSSDIAYCLMESIDLLEKVKIEESCVNVEDSVLHAIARRARKQRSYKKQLQDALTSKKRLVKEYEHLAIWFGDIGLDSSQAATSNKENSGTHHAGDSEWELI